MVFSTRKSLAPRTTPRLAGVVGNWGAPRLPAFAAALDAAPRSRARDDPVFSPARFSARSARCRAPPSAVAEVVHTPHPGRPRPWPVGVSGGARFAGPFPGQPG